jgi:hypothetical protein
LLLQSLGCHLLSSASTKTSLVFVELAEPLLNEPRGFGERRRLVGTSLALA